MTGERFKEESSPALGEQAAATWTYDYLPADHPDHLYLEGLCPHCQHHSQYRWPLYIVREDAAPPDQPGQEKENATEIVTVRCQCDEHHPGSNGEKGCGRYWALTVLTP
jgi:hypothetical protein